MKNISNSQIYKHLVATNLPEYQQNVPYLELKTKKCKIYDFSITKTPLQPIILNKSSQVCIASKLLKYQTVL